MLASEKNHKDLVELIINRGINVNEKQNDRYTALILASQNGHKEIVELLLEKGSNIYKKDTSGKTVLTHISTCLRNFKEKLEKDNFIEVIYMIIRKVSEDYISICIFK